MKKALLQIIQFIGSVCKDNIHIVPYNTLQDFATDWQQFWNVFLNLTKIYAIIMILEF